MKRDEKDSNKLANIIEFTLTFAMFAAVVVGLFIVSPVQVAGDSMFGHLKDGDYLLLYDSGEIERNDIVAFESPTTPGTFYVKRVIAVAGDTVEYREDRLYVNGEFVEEPYLDENKRIKETLNSTIEYLTPNFTLEEVTGSDTVPEGEIFTLGDNRLQSNDSRHFGNISLDTVTGKMFLNTQVVLDIFTRN